MKKIILIALLALTAFFQITPASAIDSKSKRTDCQSVPILMYHHVTANAKRQNAYTVHADEFESDVKYLKESGYHFIVMRDLIQFVYERKPLPQKPVMLTFDDGYLSFYQYAFETLKKYDAKAVLSIIGSCSQKYSETADTNVNYSHVTWDNLKELNSSGLVEIQNHTYDMHKRAPRKGTMPLPGETVSCYKKNFEDDVMLLQSLLEKKVGIVPNTFTYPFGYISKESESTVKKLGFLASLSCYERVSTIRMGEADCLYILGRYNRASGCNFKELMAKIDSCIEK